MSVLDPTATEGVTSDSGLVRLSRTGPTTASLTVSFSRSGSATLNADYNTNPVSGNTVVIPAGASAVELPVRALTDAAADSGETVVITATNTIGGLYTVGAPSSATVTIVEAPALAAVSEPSGGDSSAAVTASSTPSQPTMRRVRAPRRTR